MSLRILIPVALIAVGAGLYGLSGRYLGETQSQQQPEAQPEEVTESLVAVQLLGRDIAAGDLLTEDDLVPAQLKESEARAQGYTADPEKAFFSYEVGMAARQDLTKGQMASNHIFVAPEDIDYLETVIQQDMVPYPLKVEAQSLIGGLITHGSRVDIIALSSIEQNLANESRVGSFQSVSISPVLMGVRVLKVDKQTLAATKNRAEVTETSLILELTRKQVATLSIARNIAQIEVHKSVGQQEAGQLNANSGDVLPTYRAIKEYRADEMTIK